MVPTINAVPLISPTRLLRPTIEMFPSEIVRFEGSSFVSGICEDS